MIKNKEAEILLLGLPNSGKSTLINALTKNKTSKMSFWCRRGAIFQKI